MNMTLKCLRRALLTAVAFYCFATTTTLFAATLVPLNSDWRYLDDGSDQGTAWRANGFDDNGWSSGPAELGYGDGDEATIVGFGPEQSNKYPTTYFRHTFFVDDASIFTQLVGELTYDDGAVVYLNGSEIFRINIDDPFDFSSYATAAADYVPEPFLANAGLLVDGDNVLAVEMHQANGNSSDISMELVLVGNTGIITNEPPTVSIISPADGSVLTAPATFTITASASDSDIGGAVTSVEFFQGPASLGTDGSTPFTVDIVDLPIGAYQFTATATDNLGATATSAPINISVLAPSAPTIQSVNPPPGAVDSLDQISVTFSEPVAGVRASDLIVNGHSALSVTGSGASYTFGLAHLGEGTIHVAWNGTTDIYDQENPPQFFDTFGPGARWQYTLTDDLAPTIVERFPAAGATVRGLDEIEVRFSEPVIGVDAADLSINGVAALSVDGSGDGPYTFEFPQPAPGTITVQWVGGHGIMDQATPANAFAGGNWTYQLNTNAVFEGQIVINEIMFNPAAGLAAEEFIELFNRGGSSVNLAGWALTRGVNFTFPDVAIPAGGYLAVAADVAAFNAAYPGVGDVVGGWTGRLSNGHEEVELEDASGDRVDLVAYADEGDFATRVDLGGSGLDWVTEADGLGRSLELRQAALDNEHGQNWGASLADGGTPGAANSLAAANLAPMILEVAHFPVIPKSSEFVTVTARIVDESASGLTVQLWHREISGGTPGFANVAMADDGASNDGLAGDGIFGAVLPAMNDEAIVEFYVEAEDAGNRSRTWPAPVNDNVQSANAYYQVDDEVYVGNQPIYRLVMQPGDLTTLLQGSSDAQVRNTTFISVEGSDVKLRYLAGVRRRGASSVNSTPPTMKLEIPSDRTWNGKSSLNLNSINTHAQVLGSALSLKAGLPAAQARAVQLRFNGSNESRSDAQMYGSYAHVEVLDNEWAADHFPLDDDGNAYSKRRGGGFDCDERLIYLGDQIQSYINCAYDKESNSGENDWSDLMAMLFAVDDATTPDVEYVQAMERNANVQLWLRYFAVHYLMNYNETALGTVANDDYNLYRGVIDPRFMLLPHDFDSIFGTAGNAANSIFLATETDNVDRFLFHPEFEPRYYEEFRFQLANAFAAENVESLMDQVLGDWVPAGALQSMKDNAAGRRNSALSQLPPAPMAVRAAVAGEPDSPTYLNTATLTVGGEGITHYRYRLNGGTFGAQSAVGTPITLSGLADGIYTVFVIGRNGDGDWQAEADATASRTWAVLSNLRGVVINEILARNESAVNHEGTFPDVVELFNAGNGTVDLSGRRLTDDLDQPDKFVIPAGTTLGSGNYLVLYANDPDGTSGLHLGFGLAAEGETLYLLDTDANGSRVLDSIEFGLQLPDHSVGRLPGGAWGLASPTPGSANAAVATGDPAMLKINEWLADGAAPFFDDFIELYNPDARPVALGGLYLTDQPIGDPFRHGITRLSFIRGQSYQSIIADGNPDAGADHVDFQLAREEGEIALVNASGAIIDCVVYGPQQPAISMGRSPNGSSMIVFFDLPTPGAGNPAVSGPLPPITVNLFPLDGMWAYEASGTDLGTSWRNAGFDDSGWSTGQAVLGDETTPGIIPEPIRTLVPSPQNGGPIATYYRTHFDFDAGLDISALQARFLLDDGAVFYLNGVEVERFNMRTGPVNFDDTAAGSHEANVFETLSFDIGELVDGDNVLAVEVHQQGSNSSDTIFGLQLDAIILTNNPSAAGVVINEVLANNATLDEPDGSNPDWVEFYNPSNQAVDLEDMSLTDDPTAPRRWVFPPGSVVPAMGYLRIDFDSGAPASGVNTGFGLSAGGDAVYLFDAPGGGGALLDAIIFGIQAPDWPIGRLPDGDPNITLVQPTPNGVNIGATLGDPYQLKINEWMADPASGDDWFEIYNPNAQPVALGGLHLTDDLTDRLQYAIPARSYISSGARGFQEFQADDNVDAGGDHVNFRLGAGGDSLGIADTAGTLIDGVTFGQQLEGVSQGRLPDGAGAIVDFPVTASPGESNFLPIENIAINEVMSHSDLPFEDAIELRNLSGAPVDIGGWFLSDARTAPKKFRIPDGTVVAANGFVVFYENEFNPNPGGPLSFSLSSARGDDVFLSAALANGTLTGFKNTVEFGAAANGVSFGRYETSVGVDFTAMSLRTFGADNPESVQEFRTGNGLPNSQPLVGPVVINEIMYHPPDIDGTNDNTLDEYIELHNFSGAAVPLFDVNFPTNTWRLDSAVEFDFPHNVSLPAGGYLLVVSFDPVVDTVSLNAFRATYGLSAAVPVYGPYDGKLDNSGESVELYKPDPPQGAGSPDEGLVPYVLADLVRYGDVDPWATSPDGFGDSLQRIDSALYGNDPLNWAGDAPTPGANNQGGSGNSRPVLDPIGNKIVIEGNLLSFTATASDADEPAQTLTFSLAPGAPSGASIHPSTGTFTWTPTESQGPAGYSITVIVTDDGAPAQNDTETISVTVNEANQPPVLAAIGNRTVNEGQLLSFTASAMDDDLPAQDLNFSLGSNAPGGASINSQSGVFAWTPTEEQGPGIYSVTVRVTDVTGNPMSDSETISITVNEVNQAPVLSPIGDRSVAGGGTLTFMAMASDNDLPAQTLTFSLDAGAPSGAAIHPQTGAFSWTPTQGQSPSENAVTVRVTDHGSPALNDFETFNISVTVDPVAFQLMDYDHVWRYDQGGADLGTAWRDPAFDDSGWSGGPGLLGEESRVLAEPIRTDLLAPASGGPITTYFRTHFTLPAEPGDVTLTTSSLIDDGMIVYLNGVEAFRFNMPEGAVSASDTSSGSHEANVIETIPMPAANLICGDNVLAVEVHQQNVNSSDIVFGMVLVAELTPQAGASIVTHPVDRNVDEGEPVNFSVTATGSCPVYQWYKDDVAIPGANASTFAIAAAQLADAGDYHVVASNLFGMATSSTATLTVNPVVTTPPEFTDVSKDGDDISLEWVAVPGRSYQVQYKMSLSDSIWIDLGAPILATGSSVSIVDGVGANTTRFYRVILLE